MMKKPTLLIYALFFSLIGSSNGEPAIAKATFAGGCFWCMEPPFDKLPGVLETISGFTGGTTENPNYEQVSSGRTGHYEAIQILYNPDKISYQQLLLVFWKNIDPSDGKGQFCDKGSQYRSAIFYHSDEQKKLALESKRKLEKNKPFPESIKTSIIAARNFYPAETHHQNYYRKNPLSYKFYRATCGRDKRLRELWGQSN